MEIRKLTMSLLLTATMMILPAQALAQEDQTADDVAEPAVYWNGEQIEFSDPVIMSDGRIMVPIRQLVDTLGGEVEWVEEAGEAIIHSEIGDEIVFQPDQSVMWFNGVEYLMDVAPLVNDQSTYIPLRHAAQFLHAKVDWDEETLTTYLTQVAPHVVLKEDTLASISALYGIDEHLLSERNQLTDGQVVPGDLLKTVIPDIMANKLEAAVLVEEEAVEEEPALPYTEEELMLLAKITMVEAGYESYEGQLAVANVVLNRVNSPKFPNTIYDVIYAPGQFPPARNGQLDNADPNESVWKAVRAAAAGENNVEGAVYFHNPKVTSGGFWNSLTEVARIGNHRFVK